MVQARDDCDVDVDVDVLGDEWRYRGRGGASHTLDKICGYRGFLARVLLRPGNERDIPSSSSRDRYFRL